MGSEIYQKKLEKFLIKQEQLKLKKKAKKKKKKKVSTKPKVAETINVVKKKKQDAQKTWSQKETYSSKNNS